MVVIYTNPTTPPIYVIGKKPSENNEKSKNVNLCGLSEPEFIKVIHFESTKQIWDKFKISMKAMTRLRRKISKLIEDNLRVQNERRRKCCILSSSCG
jgi:hypothetical protein